MLGMCQCERDVLCYHKKSGSLRQEPIFYIYLKKSSKKRHPFATNPKDLTILSGPRIYSFSYFPLLPYTRVVQGLRHYTGAYIYAILETSLNRRLEVLYFVFYLYLLI
ncbi:hypothetical protein AMTRI_Chr01g112770 [Amborella trichopoda]